MFRFTHVLVLVAVMASAAFAQSPYLFTPSGRDDAAALRAALIAYRRVQINGTDIRIDTPINLVTDDGVPLHNVLVEPAPGINRTTIHTAIIKETNPPRADRAPFNYNGGYEPGSFLTTTVPAGVMSVTIRDPELLVWWLTSSDIRRIRPFRVGDYICLNDTSRVPDVTVGYAKDVQDGATEVRQILAIEPSGRSGELRLYLESPLRRPHQATVTVAHCQPLRNVVFRNLRFTSDNNAGPQIGIHMHMAFNAEISNVSSVNWRGNSLVLIDNGGRNNTIKDCYATGVNSPGDLPNVWGIAVEGQEGTTIINCGAERYNLGIFINYSVDTFAVNSSVKDCTYVGLSVSPDIGGNPSINSGFIGGRVLGGGFGAYVGTNCVDCVVDVSIERPYWGIKVGLGTYNTRVLGSILGASQYGVGIDSIDGGTGDGAVSSRGTLLNATASCTNTKLVLLKGTQLSPHAPSELDSYYKLGPLFYSCP